MPIDYTPLITKMRQELPFQTTAESNTEMAETFRLIHRDFWLIRQEGIRKPGNHEPFNQTELTLCRRYTDLTHLLLTCLVSSGNIRTLESALFFLSKKLEIIYRPDTDKYLYSVMVLYQSKDSLVMVDTGLGEVIGYYQGMQQAFFSLSVEALEETDRIMERMWRFDRENSPVCTEVLRGGTIGIYTLKS